MKCIEFIAEMAEFHRLTGGCTVRVSVRKLLNRWETLTAFFCVQTIIRLEYLNGENSQLNREFKYASFLT